MEMSGRMIVHKKGDALLGDKAKSNAPAKTESAPAAASEVPAAASSASAAK